MHTARLIAKTVPVDPEFGTTANEFIAYVARVSNPGNQWNHETADKLVAYLERERHWSPFEMFNIVIEINTTRDIARQLLRHHSLRFQEFCISGESKITFESPHSVKNGKSRAARSIKISELWDKWHNGAAPIKSRWGNEIRIPQKDRLSKMMIRVFDEESRTFVTSNIVDVYQTGVKPTFKVTLENGQEIECTKEHKFLTESGFKSLEDACGLRLVGNTAVISESVALGCNGVEAYKDAEWMRAAKARSIENKTGLSGIAKEAGCSTHTIRKWLKRHSLQFTKKEVASYTKIWNKGVKWTRPRHTLETIEKMRRSARRGPDSNLWRGGADRSERLKIADWCNAHRSEFLIKSNYKCNRCESNKNLELHHIETVADRPDLAYEKTNIEVLCRKCHREHHNTNGDMKSWRERSKGRTLVLHWSKIKSVEYVGEQMTYDLEVAHKSHNYVANKFVVHNSQRYAAVEDGPIYREARLQDTENRQNSIEMPRDVLWEEDQQYVWKAAVEVYNDALARGIAKEVARAVLPEGLTPSRLFCSASVRSWLHYLQSRLHESTQKEHRLLAQEIEKVVRGVLENGSSSFCQSGG